MDPPYYQTAGYDAVFEAGRYAELAELLASVKGRFMLTLNANDFIRKTFSAFHCATTMTRYSVGGKNRHGVVGELLFTNFALPPGKGVK